VQQFYHIILMLSCYQCLVKELKLSAVLPWSKQVD